MLATAHRRRQPREEDEMKHHGRGELRIGAPNTDDVAGHAAALYEGDYGFKGRPGSDPALGPASAGGGLDPYKLGLLGIGILAGVTVVATVNTPESPPDAPPFP
jgi:hypothetical protein